MSKMTEYIKIVGDVEIVKKSSTGEILETVNVKNMVVTAGKEFIAARVVGAPTAMSHMAIGSGTTEQVLGDTSLESELGRAALVSSSSAGRVATFTCTFDAGVGTGAITEAGIFNDATTGTMLCRTTFPVVNKSAGDIFDITWTLTVL